jgi:hypothetical protein
MTFEKFDEDVIEVLRLSDNAVKHGLVVVGKSISSALGAQKSNYIY